MIGANGARGFLSLGFAEFTYVRPRNRISRPADMTAPFGGLFHLAVKDSNRRAPRRLVRGSRPIPGVGSATARPSPAPTDRGLQAWGTGSLFCNGSSPRHGA